jgi:hypothetical protein
MAGMTIQEYMDCQLEQQRVRATDDGADAPPSRFHVSPWLKTQWLSFLRADDDDGRP